MKRLIQLIKENGLFSRGAGPNAREVWDYDYLAVYQEDEEWHIAPAYIDGTKIELINDVERTFANTTNKLFLAQYVRGAMRRNEGMSLDEAIGMILRLTNAEFSHSEIKDKYLEIEAREARFKKGGAK